MMIGPPLSATIKNGVTNMTVDLEREMIQAIKQNILESINMVC